MKKIIILLCVFVFGCTYEYTNHLSYEDSKMRQYLLGDWEYEAGPEDCREYGVISFKRNGTYTRSSESCSLADDGFGYFYYGWYIADGYICFVPLKEEYASIRHPGFSKENCDWKVIEYGKEYFLIQGYYWEAEGENKEYAIVKFTR